MAKTYRLQSLYYRTSYAYYYVCTLCTLKRKALHSSHQPLFIMIDQYTRQIAAALLLLLLGSTNLLAQDNLIANGEFDQGFDGWQEFTNAGSFSTEVTTGEGVSGENALRATIDDPGPDPFSIGIRQFLTASAQVDTIYNVSFQAKADANRTMVMELKLGGENQLYETVELTTEANTYTFSTTSAVAGEIAIGFFMGTESPNIVLDNVQITTGELPPVSDESSEVVTNGEFDEGLTGWVELSNDGGDLMATVGADGGLSGENALQAVIDVPGPNSFSTGILQDISRPSKIDYSYTITFQARAAADREMTVQYRINEQSKIFTTVQLTTEPQNYRLTVSSDEVGAMQLLFFMGIEEPTIYLDAVSVQEKEIVPEPEIPLDGVESDYEQVAIGGGGYVTGVYYHPTTPNLLYMRTDVGGSFRYDYNTREWVSLFTDFTLDDENYYGNNALALAPSDDRYVYVSTGKSEFFGGKDVLVSKDRGQTWATTGLDKELFASSDFYNKIIGPAIAVDPKDATKVYAGTANDGLWYKDGDTAAWVRVEGVPAGVENLGVKAIVFAPNGDLFVGLPQVGIFRRESGSSTFEAIDGAPAEIYKLAVNAQSHLYVASAEGVQIYQDDTWTAELSGKRIAGISIHPADNNRIVAIETGLGNGLGEIYSTTDGGANWKTIRPLTDDYRRKRFPAWYPNFFWANSPSAIAFDPNRTNAVTYADFFAVWHTNNIHKDVSAWSTYSRGHEETYIIDLVSPTEGPRLMSGIADVLGFQWDNRLDRFPKTTIVSEDDPIGANGAVNNGTSIDFCPSQPQEKVLAANINNFGGQGFLFRTNDNFQTWTKNEVPGSMGRVAMSATDPKNMVIVTHSAGEGISKVYYTEDNGKTWSPSRGAPEGIIDNMFRSREPLTADRIIGGTFYLYVNPSRLYKSTDGGKSFSLVNEDLPGFGSFDKWEAAARPDAENEVWVSLDNAGLHRSVDGGITFQKIPGVVRSYTFGFGKGKGPDDPTVVYVLGQINDTEGIFFSTDSGRTWNLIETDINWVNGPRSLTGDMQSYGRVYVGSNGSGILSVTLQDAGEEALPPEELKNLRTKQILVYPNPSRFGFVKMFFYNQGEQYNSAVALYDEQGQFISTKDVRVKSGINCILIDTSELNPGKYYGVVNLRNRRVSTRIFIE